MSRIEVFTNDIRFKRNAPENVILQGPAVFDDLMPEQWRCLIQDYEIEIVLFSESL